jgi:hypothetical protein
MDHHFVGIEVEMAVKSTNSKLSLHAMAHNYLSEITQSCVRKSLAIPEWKEVIGGGAEQGMRDHC